MLRFDIKTWSCAQCGYRQDFEPTSELMDVHFNQDKRFPLDNVQAGNCPSCSLRGYKHPLTKETDSDKKMRVTVFDSQDDLSQMKKDLDIEPLNRVQFGKEVRSETSEEQQERISIILLEVPKDSQDAVRKIIEEKGLITREFVLEREETQEEKDVRTKKQLDSARVLSSDEIKAIRTALEDV